LAQQIECVSTIIAIIIRHYLAGVCKIFIFC